MEGNGNGWLGALKITSAVGVFFLSLLSMWVGVASRLSTLEANQAMQQRALESTQAIQQRQIEETKRMSERLARIEALLMQLTQGRRR